MRDGSRNEQSREWGGVRNGSRRRAWSRRPHSSPGWHGTPSPLHSRLVRNAETRRHHQPPPVCLGAIRCRSRSAAGCGRRTRGAARSASASSSSSPSRARSSTRSTTRRTSSQTRAARRRARSDRSMRCDGCFGVGARPIVVARRPRRARQDAEPSSSWGSCDGVSTPRGALSLSLSGTAPPCAPPHGDADRRRNTARHHPFAGLRDRTLLFHCSAAEADGDPAAPAEWLENGPALEYSLSDATAPSSDARGFAAAPLRSSSSSCSRCRCLPSRRRDRPAQLAPLPRRGLAAGRQVGDGQPGVGRARAPALDADAHVPDVRGQPRRARGLLDRDWPRAGALSSRPSARRRAPFSSSFPPKSFFSPSGSRSATCRRVTVRRPVRRRNAPLRSHACCPAECCWGRGPISARDAAFTAMPRRRALLRSPPLPFPACGGTTPPLLPPPVGVADRPRKNKRVRVVSHRRAVRGWVARHPVSRRGLLRSRCSCQTSSARAPSRSRARSLRTRAGR